MLKQIKWFHSIWLVLLIIIFVIGGCDSNNSNVLEKSPPIQKEELNEASNNLKEDNISLLINFYQYKTRFNLLSEISNLPYKINVKPYSDENFMNLFNNTLYIEGQINNDKILRSVTLIESTDGNPSKDFFTAVKLLIESVPSNIKPEDIKEIFDTLGVKKQINENYHKEMLIEGKKYHFGRIYSTGVYFFEITNANDKETILNRK